MGEGTEEERPGLGILMIKVMKIQFDRNDGSNQIASGGSPSSQ
jgi:hypothetical protein